MSSTTTFVSIGDLRKGRQAVSEVIETANGCCSTTGGAGKSSCGSSAGPDDMPAEIWDKVKNHPCYSEEAHHYFARMHVAVAPACNIQCNYCIRKYDCSNESRPGVVSELLTPDQAIKKVLAVAAEIPQMTVLGIAGPGDPLANPDRTFETFRQLSEKAPDIKLCVSTNGLSLPEHVDEIAKAQHMIIIYYLRRHSAVFEYYRYSYDYESPSATTIAPGKRPVCLYL